MSCGQARLAMKAMGASDGVIETLLEMYRAMDSGLLVPAEPRTRDTTTATTLEQFARDVIMPQVAVPAGAHF